MAAQLTILPDGTPTVTIPEDTATATAEELCATVLGLTHYALRTGSNDNSRVIDAIKDVVTQVAAERDRLANELTDATERNDRLTLELAEANTYRPAPEPAPQPRNDRRAFPKRTLKETA